MRKTFANPALIPLIAVSLAVFAVSGCSSTSNSVNRSLNAQALSTPEHAPQLIAAYQPWFGRPGHIDVGYSTEDRVVLDKQITQARNMGISAFIVNWYGPAKDFEDRSYAELQSAAAENGDFKVAIMYDEHADEPGRSTELAIQDLQYAYERYIGPQASVPRQAYLTVDGRPLIFIFPKDGKTDWRRVRASLHWAVQPLFIYKDTRTQTPDAFDGFYAWVQPGSEGWQHDGSNWGQDYLDHFYRTMSSQYADKLAVGAAWPGFDDSKASWSQNRRMAYRCGKTFDDSLHSFRKYFSEKDPLPFLMIETWNDYEEGTAVERGIDRCNGAPSRQLGGGD